MNVIHLNGARGWGGNEQQLTDLIPELEKLGIRNVVFGVPDTPLHEYCKNRNIDFIAAKDGKLNKKANYRFLKEIVRSRKPDLLHFHTSDSLTLFMISDLLYKLKTPTVFSKKGMGNSMSFLSLMKYNYKNIRKIICVSEAVRTSMKKEVMKKKNHHKLEVVYDGINSARLASNNKDVLNLHKKYKINDDVFLIGNIANHTAAKDLPTLLKALHHLVHVLNFKNVHLIQIGEFTRYTDELKNLTDELNIGHFVTFTDFQKQATDFFSQFDVFVMSSAREGLPLTIYEAFYKKTPVVSTKAGGIPEVITDGENGYLAEVGDFETLARKIQTLLEQPEKQNQFKEKSYTLFRKKFDADKTAEATYRIYKNLINEK